MAKKQKMSAKQKQAREEAAAARVQAAQEAKERREFWKRIGIAVVAILLILGLMLPMAGLTFCGNQNLQSQQAAQQAAQEASDTDADADEAAAQAQEQGAEEGSEDDGAAVEEDSSSAAS